MNLTLTERYLADHHDQNLGVTARSFAARPMTNGTQPFLWTYAALLAVSPDTGAPLTVLDLACGDGHLLSLAESMLTPPALAAFRCSYLNALRSMCGPASTVASTDHYQLFTAKVPE